MTIKCWPAYRATAGVLLTFDKDFGELSFRRLAASGCGVVLFRLGQRRRDEMVARIVAAAERCAWWPGHFTVVEESRVRVRPMPRG